MTSSMAMEAAAAAPSTVPHSSTTSTATAAMAAVTAAAPSGAGQAGDSPPHSFARWLQLWNEPTETLLLRLGRVQLIVSLLLAMYCVFNDMLASSVDSGLYYVVQAVLSLILFYALSTESDTKAVSLMNVYLGGSMLLAMLSSLYFVVLYNHLNISHRECSRIGGPFDVLYTAAECTKVIRIAKGRIARVAVFLVVQLLCIHPAVSFRIHLVRQTQDSTGGTTGSSTSGASTPAMPATPLSAIRPQKRRTGRAQTD